MDRLCIVGGKPLCGEVMLGGSKNGALPILAATLLIGDEVVLHNVPEISDVEKMCRLLSLLGATITRHDHTLHVNAAQLITARADRDLTNAMRASFYVLGPLLARLRHAEVPLPGGCDIGKRPVDYVIRALRTLGVQTEETPDVVYCSAPDGLHGATITLDPRYRSPGATFNVTMAACLASGRTVIENASADPEVESFCHFLQSAGAAIEGAGTTRLLIDGCAQLHACEHTDRERSDRGRHVSHRRRGYAGMCARGADPTTLSHRLARSIRGNGIRGPVRGACGDRVCRRATAGHDYRHFALPGISYRFATPHGIVALPG